MLKNTRFRIDENGTVVTVSGTPSSATSHGIIDVQALTRSLMIDRTKPDEFDGKVRKGAEFDDVLQSFTAIVR